MTRPAMAAAIALLWSPAVSAQIRADAPEIREYTLRNAHGMTVRFLDRGGVITAIETPDRQGRLANVVLGYGSTAEYRDKNGKNGFGALIGRYAGRIRGARFMVGGREVRLKANDGDNALHGGPGGFDVQRWAVAPFRGKGFDGARLTRDSPDGSQGFPGRLRVTVTYRLFTDDRFQIDYDATTTRATHVNFTNHSYFNLAGPGSGTVANQRMRIAANRWVEADQAGIPTGRLASVAGTPLDFREAHAIGERWYAGGPVMSARGGYNHGWAFEHGVTRSPRPVLWLSDPASGRTLTVETTEPGVVIYTGDYIDGKDVDAAGNVIHPRDGIALETQHFADSPHHASFPSTLLTPDKRLQSTTIWRFGVAAK
ncbi:aldose epimerase family protein [Sphingomonas sp. S2-65]|uniref:aldose epimerase family protein n=1 Tax=Sphingomonas sp. S2-65 TaxID=2903960 RepID=UPI001F2BC4C3|nr:aldose epimerase family protein [Sphingomonas sp. S2-65]UYY59475.1 galactose mutarotase [Sphingomonas sp. S2-65]